MTEPAVVATAVEPAPRAQKAPAAIVTPTEPTVPAPPPSPLHDLRLIALAVIDELGPIEKSALFS